MSFPHPLICAALLAVSPVLHAETPVLWKGSSEIEFSGSSTLHDWSGKVKADRFVATVMMDEQARPTHLKARVEVQAAQMDTHEPKRDANMHADMKVAKYPLITGSFDTPFEKIMPGGKAPSRLPFTLTILGRDQAVDARISHWVLKGDTATFDLDFELSLKRCGINVPSVMFVISVADTIKVHAPVKLVSQRN
jgi:polyisoprenoid-binding protein YceI